MTHTDADGNKIPMFKDMEGNEITIDEWAELFSDVDKRTIAKDDYPGGTLSTMFIGGLPELYPGLKAEYGTAMFLDTGVREVATYETREEAEEGHQRILRNLRLGS